MNPAARTHSMKLNPGPFAMIQSGRKTIELRLFDEKRRLLCVGDAIEFTNTETGEILTAIILALHPFDSFAALYRALPLLKCGYTDETLAAAQPSDMAQYYAPEEERKYGVVGIEIALTTR